MNEDNFAGTEVKPDGLQLAQEALHLFETAGIAMEQAFDTNDTQLEEEATRDMVFFAKQTELRLGLSIAVDLRRIANALERKP